MRRPRGEPEKKRTGMRAGGFVLVFLVAIVGIGMRTGRVQESSFSICVDCHETMAEPFKTNLHAGAEVDDPAATVCEACHGDATVHLETGGGGGNIFAFRPEDAPGDVLAKCKACHAVEDDLFASSLHSENDKSCLACHLLHPNEPRPGLIKAEREKLCSGCHDYGEAHMTEMNAIIQIEETALTCLTCHDPHSQKIRESGPS